MYCGVCGKEISKQFGQKTAKEEKQEKGQVSGVGYSFCKICIKGDKGFGFIDGG